MRIPESTARLTPAAGMVPKTAVRLGAVLCAGVFLLSGCHKPSSAGDEKSIAGTPAAQTGAKEAGAKEAGATQEGAKEEAAEGVTLTPEKTAALGIVTQPAKAIQYMDEAAGYGVVLSHDTIAQAAAELVTAQANERLSRSALARARRLIGTPGAVSADVEETAAEKSQIDAAALTLTRQKLSSVLGLNPPWKEGDKDNTLQALASGRIKLVRVTFPLGALSGGTPPSLRASHIGVGKSGTGWKMSAVWDAPADASVPGRSFFALLQALDVGEGERLQVWAPVGDPASGVVVPASATLMSQGKYWCFVEAKPGTFVKTEVDTGRPTGEGYFVTEGVEAGNAIVTAAAGQLLAAQSGSAAEPD